MATRDFSGLIEGKSIRSRTPLPSLLEQGYSPKALRTRSINRKLKNKNHSSSNYTFLDKFRRRPKLSLTVLIILIFLWLIYKAFSGVIVLARFKFRDLAYEKSWINGCRLRKKPLIFIRSNEELVLVWETNCSQEFEVKCGKEIEIRDGGWILSRITSVEKWELPIKASKIQVPDQTNSHFVYSAVINGLEGGETYAYSIQERTLPESLKAVPTTASYSFTWTGLSSLSPPPSIIHFAAISDNQYNIQIFHRILLALITYGKSLTGSPKPSFLIHAGDNVQNPHNLAQWQTDFWDPLTTLLPYSLGSTTPLLLTRGNHDWDSTGQNIYTGGSPPRSDWLAIKDLPIRWNHPGTFLAYSPHPRCRILVLDSNLIKEEDLKEQEDWLEWELERKEWKEASLRLVVVHVPPFLEYWDKESWTKGNESEWGSYVRTKLTPLLSLHGTTLILSGHQHAYSRGFLPSSLLTSYTTTTNSSTLPAFSLAASQERGWEKATSAQFEPGTIYTILGGAGGTFDIERVEDWGFYEKSVINLHHFIWIKMEFGVEGSKIVSGKKSRKRLYRVKKDCSVGSTSTTTTTTTATGGNEGEGKLLVDSLEWSAVGIDGKVFDEFRIESHGC